MLISRSNSSRGKQGLVEHGPFLQAGVVVIKDLREEGIEADIGAQVAAEQGEGQKFLFGVVEGVLVVALFCLAIGQPGLLVERHQSLGDGLDRGHQLALSRLVAVALIEQNLHHPVDLVLVVVALGIELGFEIEDEAGIGGLGQFSGGVVGLEGGQDVVGVIDEIHHIGGVFARMAAVQAPGDADGARSPDGARALDPLPAAGFRSGGRPPGGAPPPDPPARSAAAQAPIQDGHADRRACGYCPCAAPAT